MYLHPHKEAFKLFLAMQKLERGGDTFTRNSPFVLIDVLFLDKAWGILSQGEAEKCKLKIHQNEACGFSSFVPVSVCVYYSRWRGPDLWISVEKKGLSNFGSSVPGMCAGK